MTQTRKYDGGPAFPNPAAFNPNNKSFTWGTPGMSKREVYALHAMQAYIACTPHSAADIDDPPDVAAWSWKMADAMLNAQDD